MLERRKFLVAVGAGMATVAMPTGIVAATLKNSGRSCSSASLQQRLVPLIGSTFYLADSAGQLTKARLVALDEGPQCEGLEQFSVVFEGTDLSDGIYKVSHNESGSFDISLMPSDATAAAKIRKRAYFSLFE